MRIKVIFFDLDGTIFDIVERDAFARYKALNQLGYKVSLDEVKQRYKYGIGRMGIIEELGMKFSERKEEEYIKASFAHFTKREAVSLTKIHKGAEDVLSTLSKKYQMAIVTSRDDLPSTEKELVTFSIRQFFQLVVTRDVAARYHGIEKIPLLPFQEQRRKLYQCAIGLMRMDPANILCIGDSVGELQPAKKLGIETIGVLTGFSSKEDMEKASIPTIPDVNQLSKMLS